MGFFLNPGSHPGLDDQHADVAGLQDFTLYGADMQGAQRERRSDDPHVRCEPPHQTFMTEEAVEWLLQQLDLAGINEDEDFLGTDKYLLTLNLIAQLQQA